MVEIPKETRKAVSENPQMIIIYSLPKAGKTTICSKLEDHLIVELEPGGANYVEGRIIDIGLAKDFNELLDQIKASETKVCKYLVIDTITKLDEYSEIVGTYDYMAKPIGKSFNVIPESGKRVNHLDKRFQTVHEIGQGYGYQYSRNVMLNWYDRLLELVHLGKVDHVIMLAHIKDKFIESKTGETVESIDLNLTGKVKSSFSARADAIGYMIRKGTNAYLSFGSEKKVICGGRCKHLNGEILISEFTKEGEIITHWDNIFK